MAPILSSMRRLMESVALAKSDGGPYIGVPWSAEERDTTTGSSEDETSGVGCDNGVVSSEETLLFPRAWSSATCLRRQREVCSSGSRQCVLRLTSYWTFTGLRVL